MHKFLVPCFLLLPLLAPGVSAARTVLVDEADPTAYPSISAALDGALADSTIDVILVRAGRPSPKTYTETITFNRAVTLRGEETAGTILSGPINLFQGAALERFTIQNTVSVANITAATIRNNIFTGVSNTALTVTPSSSSSDAGVHVTSNTFYNNSGKALELGTGSIAQITYNIFFGNGTAISRATAGAGTISSNYFYNNTTNVSQGSLDVTSNSTSKSPQFVNTATSPVDLHLLINSPACGLGAYGSQSGDASPDPTPAPPTDLVEETSAGNVKLTWTGNLACDTSIGGYRIKWRPATSSTYTKLADMSSDGSGSPSFTVDPTLPQYNFGALPTAPAAPTGVAVSPLDAAIRVTWDAPSVAVDGHLVAWGTSASDLSRSEDAGSGAGHVIDGLTNGIPYFAAVAAYANRTTLFAVAALPTAAATAETGWESRPSNLVSAPTGRSSSSYTAAPSSATPDQISGFPNLEEKKGCFVQTLEGTDSLGSLPAVLLGLLAALTGLSVLRRSRAFVRALFPALLLAGTLLVPTPSRAEDPRWALSLSGGVFYPKMEGWSDNYDDKRLWEGKLGFGFRLFRQLEIGIDGGYRHAKGKVTRTDNGTALDPALEQKLTVIPLQAYALLQFCFADNQWVVPYVAGGYSRYYYIHEIEDGDKTKGHQNGYHARGGLKILLNVFDRYYADKASQNWSIKKTYLNLEAQYAKVREGGSANTELGGMSYSGGFVIEF